MAENESSGISPSSGLAPLDALPSRSLRVHSSMRTHSKSPEEKSALKPAYFWWVFRQWWMVIVPVSIALAGIACTAIMLTYKPDYKASALIMIEDQAPYIAFSNEAGTGATARYVETQIELLRSPIVLEIVLSMPEIANYSEVAASEDRVAHLQKNLKINRINQSELYTVEYLSQSPPHAAAVSNAVVNEYLKIQERNDYDRFQRVINLLEEERRSRSLKVEKLRQRVVDLSKEVTGRDPFGYGSTLDVARSSTPYATTYHELTQVEVDIEVLSAQLQSLREVSTGAAERGEKSGRVDLEVDQDSRVLAHEDAIDELESRATRYRQKLAESQDPKRDPLYQQIERDLAKEQEALAEYKVKRKAELVSKLHDRDLAAREDEILKYEREIAERETRKELLAKKYEKEIAEVQTGNTKSVELTFAQAELDREERVFEMIAGRKLAMQTESRAPARVTVRQKAAEPKLPVSKIPYKLLVMACAACLAGPFGLAVLREISICRISDVEQLSRESAVRVIGEVSHFPIRRAAANSQSLPPKLRRQMFVYLESIDSLRTNLWLGDPKTTSRVLVVTSAAAAEGKTCLATSLAVSVGNAEKKPVLVIDGDMRSPDVATVLGTRDRPGLAELLSNQASLSDVVQRVGKTNTYVIAAGRLKGNPHHLIREDRIVPLLAQLRTQFSTIVVDTPPIFGGSESLVFAKAADSVVLSVMRDVSRSKQLRVAVERLERSGATVAGAVLNGTSSSSYAYSYGYGYYSGQLELPDA